MGRWTGWTKGRKEGGSAAAAAAAALCVAALKARYEKQCISSIRMELKLVWGGTAYRNRKDRL